MRKFAILIFVTLSIYSCNKEENIAPFFEDGNWEKINIGTNIDLTQVYFVDNLTGFISGTPRLDSIYFSDKYDWTYNDLTSSEHIITDSCKLYSSKLTRTVPKNPPPSFFKTTDGGNTWKSIQTPFAQLIRKICFIDSEIGFVITEYEGVFKTMDGGSHWTKILENYILPGTGLIVHNAYKEIKFFNKLEGYVYVDDNYSRCLIHTSDGGKSWSFISNNKYGSKNILCLEKATMTNDKKSGFILEDFGKIYKTNDTGKSWNLLPDTSYSAIIDISFVTPNVGYSIDADNLGKTIDGGAKWTTQSLYGKVRMGDILRLNAFENGDIILSDISKGNIYLANDSNYEFKLTLGIGEKQIKDLCFPANNFGFVVGTNGQIYKYSNSNRR